MVGHLGPRANSALHLVNCSTTVASGLPCWIRRRRAGQFRHKNGRFGTVSRRDFSDVFVMIRVVLLKLAISLLVKLIHLRRTEYRYGRPRSAELSRLFLCRY